ncbi:hypothetical protein HaLaN_07286 [Haematococcus lacustris]|uniref:Uncharacterized protein n=1 Tax=Haematococcus lacustris TaxID=44745 RepID=A0A699YN69_HAELA|nr:hypothetical protein HaLaN_07286 [Haematococcus lacustris]
MGLRTSFGLMSASRSLVVSTTARSQLDAGAKREAEVRARNSPRPQPEAASTAATQPAAGKSSDDVRLAAATGRAGLFTLLRSDLAILWGREGNKRNDQRALASAMFLKHACLNFQTGLKQRKVHLKQRKAHLKQPSPPIMAS